MTFDDKNANNGDSNPHGTEPDGFFDTDGGRENTDGLNVSKSDGAEIADKRPAEADERGILPDAPTDGVTTIDAPTDGTEDIAEITAPKDKSPEKKGIFGKNNALFIAVALLFIVTLLVRTFLMGSITVIGDSMEPNLSDGDVVLINKIASPEVGDVVVVTDNESDKQLIKRVVALGGSVIEVISDGGDYYLLITASDGQTVREECRGNLGRLKVGDVITLAEDQMFLMGDNRAISADSRRKGVFSLDQLVGVSKNNGG